MVGGRHTRTRIGETRRRHRTQRNSVLWILLGCAVVFGGLIALFTVRSVRILNLRQQLEHSIASRDAALVDRVDLEERLAMRDDLSEIEDAARERLGWVLPGEERVIFIEPPTASNEGE